MAGALSLSLAAPAMAVTVNPSGGQTDVTVGGDGSYTWNVTDPTNQNGNGNQGGGYNPGYDPGHTPNTSSKPGHAVTAPSGVDNGSVALDKTNAKKGDTVTITLKPDEGYQGVPTVKDKDGKNVAVIKVNDTTFTFVMPDGKVDVSVEFKPMMVENPFTDVDAARDAAYYDAILWAVEKGITTGTNAEGTRFSPNLTCTRAQNVTFLWRAMGKPAPASAVNPFKDVDVNKDAAYFQAILWASEKGITTGVGDGSGFNPGGSCTRAQFVTFLWRAMGKPAPTSTKNPFTDVDAEKYAAYYQAILWASEKGVTTGTGNGTTFSPDRPCTRAQVVTFLYRNMA